MTGLNVSLTINLDKLLAITGYRLRFRTNEWVECLLLGTQESFVGRGEDENEALLNALYSALPTRLAQRLLERALAEDVPNPGPRDSGVEEDASSVNEEPDAPVDVPASAPSEDTVDESRARASDPERRSLSQDEVRAYLEEWTPPPRPAAPEPVDPLQLLRSLIDRARTPSSLASDVDIIDELELLDENTGPEHTDWWVLLPIEMQRVWLGYLVARMRAVKNRVGESLPDRRAHVHEVWQRFPEFSRRARPGHVHGLQGKHEPVTGTWSGDADQLLAELRALVSPTCDAGAPEREPRSEPRAPRPKREPREDAREDQPIEWEHRETVASMRVVMYGGSPREEARVNLERTLGIGSLDWPESDRPRRVDALAQRIAGRSVDVLLVLRAFVHHSDANKLISAAQASETRWSLVDAGYGIEAVKAAIDTALSGRSSRPT